MDYSDKKKGIAIFSKQSLFCVTKNSKAYKIENLRILSLQIKANSS